MASVALDGRTPWQRASYRRGRAQSTCGLAGCGGGSLQPGGEIQKLIHHLPQRDDIPDRLAAADSFAMPSLWGVLLLAHLEANVNTFYQSQRTLDCV